MDKIKFGRTSSFIIIFVVYSFAIMLGIGVYLLCPFHFAINLLIADVSATIFVFICSLIFDNASVYDPYWSVQPPIILTAFAINFGLNTLGILIMIAVWFWAIRLTTNWAYTFKSLNHQDWRYSMLKEKTGKFYPIINFVGIHLVPTLVVYGCILPAVFAIAYSAPCNVFGVIFCSVSILATTLQGIADIQMHQYQKNKTTPFIRQGLWKYCRHPNYLGEILQWWGIGLAVATSLGTWLLIMGAIFNTLLFFFVSIPLADGKQCKKEGWEIYKTQTRSVLPIYKKQK